MNEGKLRLQAMRKMLKKNNDNNTLPEKSKPEQENLETPQDQVRNQGSQSKQNVPQQNKNKSLVPNQQTQTKVLDNQKLLAQQKEQQVPQKINKKPSNQQIRQEGQIEDDEQLEQNIGDQKQQKNQQQPEKGQSDDSQNQNGETKSPGNEIIEEKECNRIEEQELISKGDKVDGVLEKEKEYEKEDCQNKQGTKNQVVNESVAQNIVAGNDPVPVSNFLFTKQQAPKPVNPSQQQPTFNLSQTHSLDHSYPKTHLHPQTKSTPFPVLSTIPISKSTSHPTEPATKIILKQLQMIKSSIHNLAVTFRGVEFLREQMRKDSQLRKRVKERLEEYGKDGEWEVVRKMVKRTCVTENGDGMGQNGNEVSNVQKKQRSRGLVSQGDIERNMQKSRESIQHKEEGVLSKQMIQA